MTSSLALPQLPFTPEQSDVCLGNSPGSVGLSLEARPSLQTSALITEIHKIIDMYKEEFPLLSPIGLYAAAIRGDGNCLFNALSDQLFGSQDQHAMIRSKVIEHMRANNDYYKMFLEVYPGGGTRRNPKRKNAGAAQLQDGPTAADIDRVFNEHVDRMARGGTWGDNIEIQAFAATFDVNVRIYQRDLAYMISAPSGNSQTTAHIAYHAWQHYSSIRNVDGPHTGMPNVSPRAVDPQVQQQLQQDLQKSKYHVQDWQMQALSTACPSADNTSLRRALEDSKGDIDLAYDRLFTVDEPKYVSSQQSSSAERDDDSEDEDAFRGPKKRQDRRLSRTTKAQQDVRAKSIASGYHKYKSSLDNLVQSQPSSFRLSQPKASSSSSSSIEDDTWTPPPLNDGETSSGSEYTPEPEIEVKQEPTKIKIKLSMPKREDSKDSTFNPSKPAGIQKKPMSARQKKDQQKLAQKRASKERKQSLNSAKQTSSDQTIQPAVAAGAMRTLHI